MYLKEQNVNFIMLGLKIDWQIEVSQFIGMCVRVLRNFLGKKATFIVYDK